MALITSPVLLRCLIAFHLTIAYLLLTSPGKLQNQSVVHILGNSMGLPSPPSSFLENPTGTALLGITFLLIGINDLAVMGMGEERWRGVFGVLAPIRISIFMALTAYSYLRRPSGFKKYGSSIISRAFASNASPLSNSLTFTWAFLELVIWFWCYILLRDERGDVVRRLAEQNRLKEQAGKKRGRRVLGLENELEEEE